MVWVWEGVHGPPEFSTITRVGNGLFVSIRALVGSVGTSTNICRFLLANGGQVAFEAGVRASILFYEADFGLDAADTFGYCLFVLEVGSLFRLNRSLPWQ